MRRGLTLVELLVYAGILSIVATAMIQVFLLGWRFYGSAQAGAEAQQEALKAMNGLVRAVQDGASAQTQVFTSPPGLMTLSARTTGGLFQHSSSGDLIWQRWVVVYLSGQQLVQKEITSWPGLPGSSAPATMPTYATVIADATLAPRVLARDVTALSLTFTAGTPASVAIKTLTTQAASARMGTVSITLSSQVALKQ